MSSPENGNVSAGTETSPNQNPATPVSSTIANGVKLDSTDGNMPLRWTASKARLAWRRYRLANAAVRFADANDAVREARRVYGRGTPECTKAVRRRAAARASVIAYVVKLRRDMGALGTKFKGF